MLDREKGMAASLSNKNVVEMARSLYESAQEGRINYMAAVWSEHPMHHSSRFTGARGLEAQAVYGLQILALRIIEQGMSQHMQTPEAQSAESDPQAVGYDMTKGPACFDFLCWLTLQKMNMNKHLMRGPLRVGFRMMETAEEHAIHDQLRRQMYEKVIFPAVGLAGAVIDKEASYKPSIEKYTFAPIVEASRRGELVPRLQPSDEAVAAVKDYLDGRQPPVTITLRESAYWGHRNSNLEEWLKVARHLQEQGEFVVFVRDTAKASEEIEGFEVCPSAAYDLDIRLALYEQSKANLFVSNGPWYLGVLGSKPWLMFIVLDSMSPFFPETPQFWTQWHGINPKAGDTRFPWSLPTQRIVHGRDNADIIIPEWEKLRAELAADTSSSVSPAMLEREEYLRQAR